MDQNSQTTASTNGSAPENKQTSPVQPSLVTPSNANGSPANPNGEKKVGPIIAVLVIVLVLIISALSLVASRINQPTIPDDTTVPSPAATDQSAGSRVQPVTSTSTDVNSLQNDLDNSTKGLDSQNF